MAAVDQGRETLLDLYVIAERVRKAGDELESIEVAIDKLIDERVPRFGDDAELERAFWEPFHEEVERRKQSGAEMPG